MLRFGPPLVSLTALLWAGQALAQTTTVSTDTTTPLITSKAGDVTVQTGASIKPTTAGAAITVDSNNNVSNAGTIAFHNLDSSTGILVLGGHTSNITNTGTITVDEDTASTTDSNGIVHGPFAKGANRYGIRLVGPGAVTGSISSGTSGVISAIGNNSAGISVETDLVGSISSLGGLSAQGTNSIALRSTGSVSGGVTLAGAIAASGQGAQAVSLSDIGGALNINGTVTSTGYRYTTRSTNTAFLKLLTADDLLQGGAAVTVAGNVGGGILLNSVSTTDSAGNVTTATANVTSAGAAPALVVGAAGRNVAIGNVGAGADAFGIEIKGSAIGNGVYDGVSGTGVQVGVANGGAVTTGGGIRVTGVAGATAYAADATGVHLLSGVQAPVIRNEGNLAASISLDAAGAGARALVIEAGANVQALQNTSTLTAQVTGQKADAIAVLDRSGTLTEIENIRSIGAGHTGGDPTAAVTGQTVALDLTANTSGVHIIQTDPSAGATPPSMLGDIRTGSGGDRLEILAGTVTGDLSLGAGANALTIGGGATVKGRLTAQGGTLALGVTTGTLQVNSANTLSLTSLDLGAGSQTILTADPSIDSATRLDVVGNATIASGAKIGVRLNSLLTDTATYTLIRADHLTSGSIDTSLLGSVPFLYNSSLQTNAAAGTVSATLSRKTAAQLALPTATAAAYDPIIAAVNRDAGLRGALLAQSDRSGLINLYNQLLPVHSSSIFDTAQATVEAFARPVDDRQDPRGSGFWVQETNLGLFSDGATDQPGYKAWSFGVVGGYELPATALGVLGVTVGGATSTIYPDKVDSAADLHANMMEAGIYWRATRGGFSANARLAGDYVKVTSDRVISVLGGDGLAVNRTAAANWSAYGVNARLMASYERVFAGHYYFRPLASLDYLRLTEGSYSETGGGAGMDLSVESRTSSRVTAFAGVALGAAYGVQRDWGPEVTLGYKGVASNNLGVTTARFVSGGNPFTLRSDDVSGQGAAAHIALKGENASGAFAVEGGAETRDGLSIYDLRLAGHIQF
ncbi:MAG: autotransporter domain-containing protein [Phenylobacterium sp.]